jgi:TolB-like protein/Flp pilus assembly protein TadD
VSFTRRLKERQIVQWALAYLAGAWLLLQVADFLRENFGWTETAVRSVAVLLGAGFFVVLVVAWYHGEKGRQRVSAVESVLLITLLAIAAVAVTLVRRSGEAGERTAAAGVEALPVDPASIAVLPFENLSVDLESEYFSVGITDDIITQLAKIGALKVISRTSVMRYRGRADRSLPEIGRELGVALVLEGGVRRSGDRLRITAQLIEAGSDVHLWAETYDRALAAEDLFEMQSDIARSIAAALELELTGEEAEDLKSRPTGSFEAYDLNSQARYLHIQRTVESRWAAIDLYRQAITADSGYAPAYAGLAGAYLGLLLRGSISREEAVVQARPAVERALQLDPRLAEAHAVSGMLLERGEGRYEEAERAYRRALELSPGYAAGHASLGILLMSMGRLPEAAAELRRAVELDPLSLAARANLALVASLNRHYEEAERQARRILELDSDFAYGHYLLGYALSDMGQHGEAIAAFTRASELDPSDLDSLAGLAYAHARAGHRDEALEILLEVERRGGPLKEIALVYGQLGEVDRAFEYLERALATSPGELTLIRVDPSADPLRADPRFDALLEKAGVK